MESASRNIVRLHLIRERISQKELANRARVSQPTVSRALVREPKRYARAYDQLISFIHKQSGEPGLLPPTIADAVEEVWDGTEAHEKALARLIESSSQLWPNMKGRE